MGIFPAGLSPAGEFEMATGDKAFRIQKFSARFKRWAGSVPFDRYGGKAVLNANGRPLFAELLVLEMFIADGWDGVWIDNFRNCYRRNWSEVCELPSEKKNRLDEIARKAGGRGGCFDVFVWRRDTELFLELKLLKKDRIRSTQARWVSAALACGVPSKNLVVLEWDLL